MIFLGVVCVTIVIRSSFLQRFTMVMRYIRNRRSSIDLHFRNCLALSQVIHGEWSLSALFMAAVVSCDTTCGIEGAELAGLPFIVTLPSML